MVNLSDDDQHDKSKYTLSNFKIDPNRKIMVHKTIEEINGKKRWKVEYYTLEEFCMFLIINGTSLSSGCLPEFKKPNRKDKPLHQVITHQIRHVSNKRVLPKAKTDTKKAKMEK